MYTEIWQKSCRSVCAINFYSSSNVKVLSLTGFKLANQVVTDNVIYNVKDARTVEFSFFSEDGLTRFAILSLSYQELLDAIPEKAEFGNLGIVLFPADYAELAAVPSLVLCTSCRLKIGRSIAVIGYQSEHNNLSLKPGIISSNYTNSKGLGFIQYDGTIKPGNSGAPLLDIESGNVIGVVTNKEMGFVKSYKELNEIIDSNLAVLREHEGKSKFFDVDLAQVLSANQNQIKHILKEFFLNATVRVGFALEIEHVIEYLDSKLELDIDSNSMGE